MGQTGGLISERIWSHLSDRDSDMYEFLNEIKHTQFGYWFLEEHDGGNRDDFEHSLFWHYGCIGPIFNKSVPPGQRVRMYPPF